MKNNDDIPTTDTNEIKQLINRVKRGELDQGDALLIEKLLNMWSLASVRRCRLRHTRLG
jgi:hypothetical protein